MIHFYCNKPIFGDVLQPMGKQIHKPLHYPGQQRSFFPLIPLNLPGIRKKEQKEKLDDCHILFYHEMSISICQRAKKVVCI